MIPDKPPWPAKRTSGTPDMLSCTKTPSFILLSWPDNYVNRILLSSMIAIPQGLLSSSAITSYSKSSEAKLKDIELKTMNKKSFRFFINYSLSSNLEPK